MKLRHRYTVAAITATTLFISACGSSEPPTPPQDSGPSAEAYGPGAASPTASAPAPTTGPAPRPNGLTEEAAERTAERFLIGWTTFIPWDFNPAEAWFGRWAQMATPPFLGRMQLSVDQMWSWTWNQEKKAFDTRMEGQPQTWIAGHSAVTRMTVSRQIMGINARLGEGEVQTLTYDVFMQLYDNAPPRVADVTESAPDAPIPSPTWVRW